MLRLQSGALVCEIEPRLGGCIAGLWWDGVPVLRSAPAAQLDPALASGGFAMVPFANRIAHANLQWRGTQHPLVRAEAEQPHAIRGVGWQRPWELLESEGDFALLAYEHRPDAAWPFAFDSSQTVRVREGALELTLSLTNQSRRPAPCGLGWQHFFAKRPRSRIAFQATGRWETDAPAQSARRRPSTGLDAACGFLDVDHCFEGWSGQLALRDELLHTRLTSGLSRLVVFTNDTRDFVAVEPVSHVDNALSLAAAGADPDELGLAILEPGASISAHMSVNVERAK